MLCLFRDKATGFNLVTVQGSAKINVYTLIVYLRMYTCKSYLYKKRSKMWEYLYYVNILHCLHGIQFSKKLDSTVSE